MGDDDMSVEIEATGAQGRWDATFAKLDRSCPARRADEAEMDYLRRLSRIGRKYIPRGEDIARVSFAQLPDSVVPQYAELMREAVEKNAVRTDNMVPGDMRAVLITDENTGMKQRLWYGPTSFVRNPLYGHRDCRKVVAINAPQPTRLYVAQGAEGRLARGW
jgi:hypothetical protein